MTDDRDTTAIPPRPTSRPGAAPGLLLLFAASCAADPAREVADTSQDTEADTSQDTATDTSQDTEVDTGTDGDVDTDACDQPHVPDPRFDEASELESSWCVVAQILTANLETGQLDADDLVNTVYGGLAAFAFSKPELLGPPEDDADAGADGGIDHHEGPFASLSTYLVEGSVPCAASTPELFTTEIWCKMKTQDAFVDAFGMDPAGPEAGCDTVNAAALAWAADRLTGEELLAYETAGPSLSLEPGPSFINGNVWLNESAIELVEVEDGEWVLRSPFLRLGDHSWVPENLRDMHYCKLWSPARALAWMLDFR